MDGVRHCPDCWTEYVPGITTCADCGAPLAPGPLPERRPQADGTEAKRNGAPDPAAASPADTLLFSRPGLEAEHLARALNLEGIPCLLECEGVRRPRLPNGDPGEPLAVTLPVSIYVPADSADAAREVAESLAEEDLVGEQWAQDTGATRLPTDEADIVAAPPAARTDSSLSPRPEGTSTRLALALVVVGLVLLLFMSR